MTIARGDDSHDGRYTHPSQKASAPADPHYPKVLYGKPYPSDGAMKQDTLVVKSPAEEAEAVNDGAWKVSMGDWNKPAGFARVRTLLALLVVLIVGATAIPMAQSALTATTLAAAQPQPTQGNQQATVSVASATNIAVGTRIYIDRELEVITATTPVATIFQVARGQGGTSSAAHASSALVYAGPGNAFYATDVNGPCVSTNESYLPHINVLAGNVFNCAPVNTLASSTASTWARWAQGGIVGFNAGRLTGWTYVTQGALTVQPGIQYIGSSGALAMTLVNPTTAQNGMVMTFFASTAQAHTITYTAGFNGGTTARDVATFGGAIGDQITVIADGGIWYVLNTRNVTLG